MSKHKLRVLSSLSTATQGHIMKEKVLFAILTCLLFYFAYQYNRYGVLVAKAEGIAHEAVESQGRAVDALDQCVRIHIRTMNKRKGMKI